MLDYKPYCDYKPKKKKAYDYWSKLKKRDRGLQKLNICIKFQSIDKHKLIIRLIDTAVLVFAAVNIIRIVLFMKDNTNLSYVDVFIQCSEIVYFILSALGWFVLKIIWKVTGKIVYTLHGMKK